MNRHQRRAAAKHGNAQGGSSGQQSGGRATRWLCPRSSRGVAKGVDARDKPGHDEEYADALYHPSSTILPRDLPDSKNACAGLRLAALMVPNVWSSVVRNTPLSMRSATSFSSMCWAIMSGVWNDERVNIDSQWIEIALPLKALTPNSGGSSIRPNLPCGAIKSAIAL